MTVNMYNRYKGNGIEYTNMIAHEGYVLLVDKLNEQGIVWEKIIKMIKTDVIIFL